MYWDMWSCFGELLESLVLNWFFKLFLLVEVVVDWDLCWFLYGMDCGGIWFVGWDCSML